MVSGKPVIDADTGRPRRREIPFLQATPVFNAQEIEGIPPLGPGDAKFSPIEAGEEILKRCPVEIRYGGNSAHYSPASDTIAMPEKGQFKTPEDFYATLAHEADGAARDEDVMCAAKTETPGLPGVSHR